MWIIHRCASPSACSFPQNFQASQHAVNFWPSATAMHPMKKDNLSFFLHSQPAKCALHSGETWRCIWDEQKRIQMHDKQCSVTQCDKQARNVTQCKQYNVSSVTLQHASKQLYKMHAIQCKQCNTVHAIQGKQCHTMQQGSKQWNTMQYSESSVTQRDKWVIRQYITIWQGKQYHTMQHNKEAVQHNAGNAMQGNAPHHAWERQGKSAIDRVTRGNQPQHTLARLLLKCSTLPTRSCYQDNNKQYGFWAWRLIVCASSVQGRFSF